jgi:hypothetical protein
MQQHLLDRYPEDAVKDDRAVNTPEKRLCRAYYRARNERNSLAGQAAKYLTISFDNKRYLPVFDPRFEKEVSALHFRMLELEKSEHDLKTRIDTISEKFGMEIRGLHDEKKRCEVEIERLILFPSEVETLRARHQVLTDLITEYTAILGPDI